MSVRLSNASQRNQPHSRFYEALWRLAEFVFVSNQLQVFTAVRVIILRLFGATIGTGCIIRPCRVHFPWNLTIHDRCWIGERVWIYNQDKLTIASDSVVSQECFLATGSHDLTTMHVITKPVSIGKCVWITTRTTVISDGITGLTIGDGVVVAPGSVVLRSLNGSGNGSRIVYGGNPVRKLREFAEENYASV
jgi:putative colanic acid biosynthesis acetyltransferase WcaF